MTKQVEKKYIIAAAVCLLVILLFFFRNAIFTKEDGGGGEVFEEEAKETILYEEGYRMLDFLAVTEREEKEGAMTCGAFRDALYAVCGASGIDYQFIKSMLPARLAHVKEEDLLYLEEFLAIYLALIEQADIGILEKHVYFYGYTDMAAETDPQKRNQTVLVTSEGERLGLDYALDYSDVLEQIKGEGSAEDEAEISKPEEPPARGYEDRLMDTEKCLDKSFLVLCAGNEIIYFIKETMDEFILHNAWIIQGRDQKITLFAEGLQRELASRRISEEINRSIADIKLAGGRITGITLKQGVIQGKVLMADDTYIEIDGYGELAMDPYMRIYKIYDELEMEHTNKVLVGYSNTDFVVIDGKICAALITEKITAENIRVLLKSDNFISNFHKTVVFTSDRPFIVKQGSIEKEYQPGTTITVNREDMDGGRIIVTPDSENAKIKIMSIMRSSGNPSYRGTLEIAEKEEGLVLINDLSLEEYLYAVVPSEMPLSYGKEALKAQAVCARSYAYNHLMGNQYRAFGAHVDDSVDFQVYNNIPEAEASIQAVKETYGMVMEYADQVITAFYFSTSSGHTSDIEDVWENGTETAYLAGSYQLYEKPELDLRDEEAFREFISSRPDTYDSGYNYYRWNTVIPADELEKQINQMIKARYQANHASVLTMLSAEEAAAFGTGETRRSIQNKDFVSKPIESIGAIKDITVVKRGTGGIITELLIEGGEAAVLVCYQTNVRMLLAPRNTELTCADGSIVKGTSMLPSAYCMIEKTTVDGEAAFSITGGGYGHGVGMSQNGARTMALEGREFDEILRHFYPETSLGLIYQGG